MLCIVSHPIPGVGSERRAPSPLRRRLLRRGSMLRLGAVPATTRGCLQRRAKSSQVRPPHTHTHSTPSLVSNPPPPHSLTFCARYFGSWFIEKTRRPTDCFLRPRPHFLIPHHSTFFIKHDMISTRQYDPTRDTRYRGGLDGWDGHILYVLSSHLLL